MASEQNQLTQTPDTINAPDIPADAVTADDGGLSVSDDTSGQQPAQKRTAEEPETGEGPKQWQDEKRAAIFESARARRAASQSGEFTGNVNDPNALFGINAAQDGEEEAPIDAPSQIQQPAAAPQPSQVPPARPLNGNDPNILNARIRTVINGVEQEITVEEAARAYQKGQAADQYLAEARNTLQQVKEFQRQVQTRPAAGVTPENTGPEFSTPEDVPNHLRGDTSRGQAFNAQDLIEKIQLGSPQEAASALESFIASKTVNANPATDYNRVLTVLEDQNAETAIRSFAAGKDDLNDPLFQDVTTKQIHRLMAEDLLATGMSMDELRQSATTPEALKQLHKQARISRLPNVRSTATLLEAGYQAAKAWRTGSQPQQQPQANQPAVQMQPRMERKEALQQQPAARRLSPAVNPQAKTPNVDQSRSAAVQRMRQARGQSV
jgi:hypothetical protein